jgi:hypothetical protein
MSKFLSDLLQDLDEQLRGFTFRAQDGFYLEGNHAVIRAVPFRRGRPGCANLEVSIEPFAFEDGFDEETQRQVQAAAQQAAADPNPGTRAAAKRDLEWLAKPRYRREDLAGIRLQLGVSGSAEPLSTETRPSGKASFPNVPLDAVCQLSAGDAATVAPEPIVLAWVQRKPRSKGKPFVGEAAEPAHTEAQPFAAEAAETPQSLGDTYQFPNGQLQPRLVPEGDSWRLDLSYQHAGEPWPGQMTFLVTVVRADIGERVWRGAVRAKHHRRGRFVGTLTLPESEIPAGNYRIEIQPPTEAE